MTSQPANDSTILLVEDEFTIRETLTEFLEDEGYIVAGAANGQEALDYLRSSPPPALVFLDLRMPVMNGLQFLEARQNDPDLAHLPVILMSADSTGQREVADNAVAGHLEKPIRLMDILDIVEQYCSGEPSQSAHS